MYNFDNIGDTFSRLAIYSIILDHPWVAISYLVVKLQNIVY